MTTSNVYLRGDQAPISCSLAPNEVLHIVNQALPEVPDQQTWIRLPLTTDDDYSPEAICRPADVVAILPNEDS